MNDDKAAMQVGEFLDDDQNFVVEGVSGTRRAQTYPNWMFQRSIDFYRSLDDTTEVDRLLHQVGIGDALKVGLKNRLARTNNLLQFAD